MLFLYYLMAALFSFSSIYSIEIQTKPLIIHNVEDKTLYAVPQQSKLLNQPNVQNQPQVQNQQKQKSSFRTKIRKACKYIGYALCAVIGIVIIGCAGYAIGMTLFISALRMR